MKEKLNTGKIWLLSPFKRNKVIRDVCEALYVSYGLSDLGNPIDPLDDLIYTIISNKTAPNVVNKVYLHIKAEYPIWNDVLDEPVEKLRIILHEAGLSNIKSKYIFLILRKLLEDFNICSLDPIRDFSQFEVEKYLTSLPGVSLKVAKCVMMYTLGYPVCPVDNHVFRISKRLGWIDRIRADQCHNEIELLIPTNLRYNYHVNCILHGRKVCKNQEPLCENCCINIHCKFYGGKLWQTLIDP